MAEATRQAPRVLVVDDTEANRYATSRILRSAGFDVDEASTGREALDAMRSHPDVVVLDVNLPDMTGFDVVEQLRRDPARSLVPVLHLSASYTTNADRARGLEQGADAYLTHPIDPTVFVATVRALLRTSTADRLLAEAAREWQATFDALADAVFLIDDDAMVQRANRAAGEPFGLGAVPLVGQSLGPLLARTFGDGSAALARRLVARPRLDKALFIMGTRTLSVTTDDVESAGAPPRTVCVLEDVTERIAAEREREELLQVAEQARLEAESANRSKSEFLAVMSHELRTPLNAIGGYAQLLELGIRGPVTDQQRADLDRIKKSQAYLLSLINDVLNFAKIESGHLKVELAAFPLHEVVEGMRDFVQPQIRERGLSFAVERCEPGLIVRADRDKVQQILLNLLSNALKFTPAGGRIGLRCATTPDGDAIVAVEDTGQGIAPDKLEWIFEPFVQVDRRFKREQEGIGLGLAISRELARAMGGELTVRSIEGQGSVFELRVPATTLPG
jgi:PAS domain S-box-containing protein